MNDYKRHYWGELSPNNTYRRTYGRLVQDHGKFGEPEYYCYHRR